MRVTLLVISALLCHTLVSAAAKKPQVVRFRPITREEYNEILKITDGKPMISEGRLITSGLAVLKNLVTLSNAFWPSIWSYFGATQAEAADVAEGHTDSYPLCVVEQEQEEEEHNVHYVSEHRQLAPMDCIIVVREDEEQEDEQHISGEYYDEPAADSMLPDYQHWPYTPPAVPPTYPYLGMPFPYSPYHQPFPYFPGFPGYPTQFAPQPSFGHGYPNHGGSFGGNHGAAGPQQQQQQSDYFPQPNVLNPYYPFLPAPASPQNNVKAGPIVHVIRGDKRGFDQKRALKTQRRSSSTKRVQAAEQQERSVRRKIRIVPEEESRSLSEKPQYRDAYAKVALNRATSYDIPVYIMTTDKLYALT